MFKKMIVIALAIIMIISMTPMTYAAPVAGSADDGAKFVQKEDNRTDPLTTKQLDLKKQALEAKLNGKAMGKTKEVAKGQYVELAREGEGMIWTVLGDFADLKHNTLPQPDRAVNNTSMWVSDFSKDYFKDLLFNDTKGANSMRNYYIEQSSGRYTVQGDVTDWITVSGDAWSYDDDLESSNGGNAVWYFLMETIDKWYDGQIAAGKTPAQINTYLAQFDVRDRYDYDGDGNFDEPDGYIDTFQSVHAGEGNEAGGGILGDAAIWSHSWYAFSGNMGDTGPDFNMLGGLQIGESSFWVGKYTIQPEDGGVGVFTHEYAHDLGLPDLYDTSGGENGTGFWTLMSSGSWMGDGTVDIGSKSSHMGAWEKFQLGWLKYEVAYAGKRASIRLGPMEYNTKQAQGLFVVLPKKPVTSNIGPPYAGLNYYYSGAGDNFNHFMYKAFTLPEGATLTAKVKYNIELDWDYAYLVYSTDNGVSWNSIQTNISTTTDPNGQNFGYGITGISSNWVNMTANLPTGNVLLGFRYWTDTNTGGFGFMADDIVITGLPADGAETDAGWTYKPTTGFHVTTGIETALFNHYYVAEYRTYKGYDSTLKTGPYFFGYLNNPELTKYVDHFAYQDGLLINYWDTSQKNNQTKNHPGKGLLLPIDAHPDTLYRVDGLKWRNRIQTYDSTFGFERTDGIPNIHVNSVLSPVARLPGVRVFDDRKSYYDPTNNQGSVMNPNTGTIISIISYGALSSFIQLNVTPSK